MSSWTRLVRFLPENSETPTIGEPVDHSVDVGKALYDGEGVDVRVYSGKSVVSAGEPTGETRRVGRLLSPLSREEVGTIRGIGLNYTNHAVEMKYDIPSVPSVFWKPAHALADPFPGLLLIPKHVVGDNAADYEAELGLIIGREAKNVTESEAMDYLLGFTAVNDFSSRVSQFSQTQWTYSKSFDGSCPIGPCILHRDQVKDIGQMHIRGIMNGEAKQESGLDDLIFSVPKIISFLSQGTTLPAGTLIMTGTPAGVGWSRNPRVTLRDGDEFRVEVSHGVGTLINKVVEEQ